MRDVVVIGGGLSGLVAAYELEKRGVQYTLIEVKNRLGGSIASVESNGFIFDSAPMCHQVNDMAFLESYLADLGLKDATFTTDEGLVVFHQGTQVFIDALQARITAPIMYRMAVSTLGMLDAERFAICMENGMLLDANALIVAAPARHAERMFYTLVPEIALRLLDYTYDDVARLSLGYKTAVLGAIQRGGRYILQKTIHPTEPLHDLAGVVASHQARWTESDLIMPPDHLENMQAIQAMMPAGVALIGSDYVQQPPRLDERIQQGLNALTT